MEGKKKHTRRKHDATNSTMNPQCVKGYEQDCVKHSGGECKVSLKKKRLN